MIHITIKGIHIELTDALKNYVQNKIGSLEKVLSKPTQAHVEIGKPSKRHKSGDDIFKAEVSLDTDGQTYFVEVTDADLYAAIDRAQNEMMELVKQGKGKKQTLLRKGRMMVKQLMKKGFYQ